MHYALLLTKISDILATIPEVKEYSYLPTTDPQKFPFVYFQPSGYTNTFDSVKENRKTYRFMMIVSVGTEGTTEAHAFGTVLPAVVDAIVTKFDTEWDGGTVDGHRVWVNIDTAEAWAVEPYQKGKLCVAPLNVEIQLNSNI